MMTEPTTLLLLVVLGALLGLDTVSVPQAQLARPVAAATITGLVLGHPVPALGFGVLLECFALETMPFGASRYPEWGAASVVGVAVLLQAPVAWDVALPVAVLGALLVAAAGGWSMELHRRVLGRRAAAASPVLAEGNYACVARLHYTGIGQDLLRGALVTAAGLAISLPLAALVVARLAAPNGPGRVLVLALAGAVGGAALWRLTRPVAHASWLLAAALAAGFLLGAVA